MEVIRPLREEICLLDVTNYSSEVRILLYALETKGQLNPYERIHVPSYEFEVPLQTDK